MLSRQSSEKNPTTRRWFRKLTRIKQKTFGNATDFPERR